MIPILWLGAFLALSSAQAEHNARAQKYYYEDIFEPYFAVNPADPDHYRSQRPGAFTSEFSVVKAKHAYRIFVLGGSIVGLLHNDEQPGDIGSVLRAALPTKKIELLNCGMAGYDSYRETLIEQEVLEYAPDLVIFLSGHNEGVGSPPVPLWILKTRERLRQWSAYRALLKKLRPESLPEPPSTDAGSDLRDKRFARNLRENIQHARRRGVKVAVVVPPRNYRAPLDAGETPYNAKFVPGWIRFLRGDYAGARATWKETLASLEKEGRLSSAQRAFALHSIACSEEKLALWDDARRSFEEAARTDKTLLARFYWHVGELTLLEKNYDKAVKNISQALTLEPSISWARVSLGAAAALGGDKKSGLRELRDVIALSRPDSQRRSLRESAAAVAQALDLGEPDDLRSDDAENRRLSRP